MRLTKIYTRNGDGGQTRLGNGTEVGKDALRVCAYGDLDELNSMLGLVQTQLRDDVLPPIITAIQHHLFDAGGELSAPGMVTDMISADLISQMETDLDRLNAELPPLQEFILPGGTPAAAQLHVARTICRRAERSLVHLNRTELISANIIRYVNRLSDLLFVMARYENHLNGDYEVIWQNTRA